MTINEREKTKQAEYSDSNSGLFNTIEHQITKT